MFKKESNEKIGAYISELIDEKFKSTRQFCKAYIECERREVNDCEIQKMANRLSQIKKGKKSIQINDLQFFTQLLEVTCEDILSAGSYFVPDAGRMTNYRFAFTKDKDIWEQYINREDKIILNTDEYDKTVIDYALEFKNYDLLKYLMDNKYIWFVGENKKDYCTTFGAGTSIERNPLYHFDILEYKLFKSDQLRRQMISLAIEHHDFDMLSTLHAREIPSLYQACYLSCTPADCDSYYDKNMVTCVANANEQILDYFSKEFEIPDRVGHTNEFIFPYMSDLIELLIKNKHSYLETLLKRCIKHNRKTYNTLKNLISVSINYDYELYMRDWKNGIGKDDEKYKQSLKNEISKNIMKNVDFYTNGNIISFRDRLSLDGIITNIVFIKEKSESIKINNLIDELNDLYNKIVNMSYYKQI